MSKLFKKPSDLAKKVSEAKYILDLKQMLRGTTALTETAGHFAIIHEFQFDKAPQLKPLILIEPSKKIYQHIKATYEKDKITLGQVFFKPKQNISREITGSGEEGDDDLLFTLTQVQNADGIVEFAPAFGIKKTPKIKKILKTYKTEFIQSQVVFDIVERAGAELLEKPGTKIFGGTTTYGEIAAIVKKYPTMTEYREQLAELRNLEGLIRKWFQDHGTSTAKEDIAKKAELENLKQWIAKQTNKGIKTLQLIMEQALLKNKTVAETNIAFAFRENNDATKQMLARMDESAASINQTLSDILNTFIPAEQKNLEINPNKASQEQVTENVRIIRGFITQFMNYIQSNAFVAAVPRDIKKMSKQIYDAAYQKFIDKGEEEARRQGLELVKAFIVLRFLAPKVTMLASSNGGDAQRTFVIIAKVFNSKANGAKSKAVEMLPFNDLISEDENDAAIQTLVEKLIETEQPTVGTQTRKTIGFIKNTIDLEDYAEVIVDDIAKNAYLQLLENETIKQFFVQKAARDLHDPQKNTYKNTYVVITTEQDKWILRGVLNGKVVESWELN